MSAKNTVCVVSKDANWSNGLKGPFKSAGLTLIAYASAEELLESLDDDKPASCVVAELHSGLALRKQLMEHFRVVPIVLLAGEGDLTQAVQAIKAGVFDVVEKTDALVESAKKAVGYFAKYQKALEEKALAAERIDSLTRRETQVLHLMVEGLPNRKIAEQLEISPKTLDIHRANLMEKMEARTTAEMCRAHLLHTVHPAHLQYILG